MKKKFLTIFLTVLLFLSAVGLGVSTVFRVDAVAVQVTAISEGAQTDANALRKELELLYDEESIFSVEQDKALQALKKYPYFRMTEFSASYPNRLFIKVVEDAEVYAVEGEDGNKFILGADGTVLDIRASAANRIDGFDNLLVKGVQATGERGSALLGDECWASILTTCRAMDAKLDGIRKNVRSVEVLRRRPEVIYCITMTEGVKIYINNPDALTEQKAEEALNEYLSLSDSERMTGRILVLNVEGEVVANYKAIDEFA